MTRSSGDRLGHLKVVPENVSSCQLELSYPHGPVVWIADETALQGESLVRCIRSRRPGVFVDFRAVPSFSGAGVSRAAIFNAFTECSSVYMGLSRFRLESRACSVVVERVQSALLNVAELRRDVVFFLDGTVDSMRLAAMALDTKAREAFSVQSLGGKLLFSVETPVEP